MPTILPSSPVRPETALSKASSLPARAKPECSSFWPPTLATRLERSSRLMLILPEPEVLKEMFLFCPARRTKPPDSEMILGLKEVNLTQHFLSSP